MDEEMTEAAAAPSNHSTTTALAFPMTNRVDNPFHWFPREAMVNLVEYLRGSCSAASLTVRNARAQAGIRELVGLANSDKYLQRLIFREFSFLWECIDLTGQSQLTDWQLHAFLRSIQAARVTRILRLVNCPEVTGVGFAPLAGSQILERIDLKNENRHAPILADTAVARILDTMLRFKLRTVNLSVSDPILRLNPILRPGAMGDFLRRLTLKHVERLEQDGSKCGWCTTRLSEVISPQVRHVPFNLHGESQCSICQKYSCRSWNRNGSTCPFVELCDDCDTPVCDDCRITCNICDELVSCNDCSKCSGCGTRYCDGCKQDYFCDHCQDFRCYECFFPHLCCDDCGRVACGTCRKALDLHCTKTTAYSKKCRFDRQCYDCGEYFTDGYPAYWWWTCLAEDCQYCLRKFCDECAPHTCGPPSELVFQPSSTSGAGAVCHEKACSCGKVTVPNPKGQQFLCGFVRK